MNKSIPQYNKSSSVANKDKQQHQAPPQLGQILTQKEKNLDGGAGLLPYIIDVLGVGGVPSKNSKLLRAETIGSQRKQKQQKMSNNHKAGDAFLSHRSKNYADSTSRISRCSIQSKAPNKDVIRIKINDDPIQSDEEQFDHGFQGGGKMRLLSIASHSKRLHEEGNENWDDMLDSHERMMAGPLHDVPNGQNADYTNHAATMNLASKKTNKAWQLDHDQSMQALKIIESEIQKYNQASARGKEREHAQDSPLQELSKITPIKQKDIS
ncbi:hypothetical protein FGO68_gene9812 [Halteria grandinella]|uniref:Uncharacterized protein n=1 Tax=Halteria grandinella TaxID=5974 RepID=A0A8J8P441_HALGN|nr:hypothetical protein FGO68_gene9812 [Halteria grandinella]